jgi:hypothetical protein
MAMEDGERREMGARGASLIKSKYTWRSVAKQMNSAYEEIKQSANQLISESVNDYHFTQPIGQFVNSLIH